MGLPMGQKLVQSGSTWARLCGTHISETTGWIYTIWSSMELSRLVVVQHHGHLTLTLDFQGHILKMLYLRNGRADSHGTKGYVSRLDITPTLWLSTFPSPMTLTLDFQGQILWKSRISGMGWQIDMERKGCESIGCYTHFVTFDFDLNHDLDLGFSRSNFENAVSQECKGRFTWNERDVSR